MRLHSLSTVLIGPIAGPTALAAIGPLTSDVATWVDPPEL
jgi:hypothetical protein